MDDDADDMMSIIMILIFAPYLCKDILTEILFNN